MSSGNITWGGGGVKEKVNDIRRIHQLRIRNCIEKKRIREVNRYEDETDDTHSFPTIERMRK